MYFSSVEFHLALFDISVSLLRNSFIHWKHSHSWHSYNNCFIFLVFCFWHWSQHECSFSDLLLLLINVIVFSVSSMPSNCRFCGRFMDIMNKMLLRVWILYYSKEYWFLLVFFSRHLTQMNSNSSLWNLNLVLYLMLGCLNSASQNVIFKVNQRFW